VPAGLAGVVALAGAALVVSVTGVVLTRRGRPFGTGPLTVHKLVALAAMVYYGPLAYRAGRSSGLDGFEGAVLAAGVAVLLVAFASGGAVSAMKEPPAWIVWSHRIGSWAAIAVSAGGLALLA